jgi:hypothetical protein
MAPEMLEKPGFATRFHLRTGLIKNGSIQAFSLLQHSALFVPLWQRQVCGL